MGRSVTGTLIATRSFNFWMRRSRFCGIRVGRTKLDSLYTTNPSSDLSTPRKLDLELPAVVLNGLKDLISKTDPLSAEVRLREMHDRFSAEGTVTKAGVTFSVLADLARHNYRFKIAQGAIWIIPPDNRIRPGEDPKRAKNRIRAPLERSRLSQLEEPSVKKFLSSAVSPKARAEGKNSIVDLIDDGASLAAALASIGQLPKAQRNDELRKVINPEFVPVSSEAKCPHTGMALMDVWRFFRHTWALEYRSTPGRGILFLVRNSARPNHPIMGIGALANPVLQLKARDEFIGWTGEALINEAKSNPSGWPTLRKKLLSVLDDALSSIRWDDLIPASSFNEEAIVESWLSAMSHTAARDRNDQLSTDYEDGVQRTTRKLPKLSNGDVDWKKASESPLFKKKRSRALAEILQAKRLLLKSTGIAVEDWSQVNRDDTERGIRIAAREARKIALASRILDLNVCGAVAPYNALLVGKLVAMIVGSKELSVKAGSIIPH